MTRVCQFNVHTIRGRSGSPRSGASLRVEDHDRIHNPTLFSSDKRVIDRTELVATGGSPRRPIATRSAVHRAGRRVGVCPRGRLNSQGRQEQAHSCSPSTWASPSGSMSTCRLIGWQLDDEGEQLRQTGSRRRTGFCSGHRRIFRIAARIRWFFDFPWGHSKSRDPRFLRGSRLFLLDNAAPAG